MTAGQRIGFVEGVVETETNVIEGALENGKVSAKQQAQIQGKDLILRIKAAMESGEGCVPSLHEKCCKCKRLYSKNRASKPA